MSVYTLDYGIQPEHVCSTVCLVRILADMGVKTPNLHIPGKGHDSEGYEVSWDFATDLPVELPKGEEPLLCTCGTIILTVSNNSVTPL